MIYFSTEPPISVSSISSMFDCIGVLFAPEPSLLLFEAENIHLPILDVQVRLAAPLIYSPAHE